MKYSFKISPISPISQPDFRKEIFQFFLYFQTPAIFLALIVYFIGYYRFQIKIQMVGLLILTASQLFAAFLVLFQKRISIAGRLTDIYPNLHFSKFGALLLSTLWLCPISAILIIIFLLTKQRSLLHVKAPLIFRFPILTATIIFIPILSTIALIVSTFVPLQLLSLSHTASLSIKNVSYWAANPTTYYIASLSEEVKLIMDVKEKLKIDSNSPRSISIFEDLSKTHSFTTAGVILIASIIVMENMKKIHTQDLSQEVKIANAQDMVSDLIQLTEIEDKVLPSILRFNPISMVMPFEILEIAIITAINTHIEAKFKNDFIPLLTDMLTHLEQEKVQNPKKLSELRAKLERTNTYKFYLNLRQSADARGK